MILFDLLCYTVTRIPSDPGTHRYQAGRGVRAGDCRALERTSPGNRGDQRLTTYNVTYAESDGWIVAWTDDEPGALAQERTIEEARESLKAAIRLLIEDRAADATEQPRVVKRETIIL